jgi:hypothetical protein
MLGKSLMIEVGVFHMIFSTETLIDLFTLDNSLHLNILDLGVTILLNICFTWIPNTLYIASAALSPQ